MFLTKVSLKNSDNSSSVTVAGIFPTYNLFAWRAAVIPASVIAAGVGRGKGKDGGGITAGCEIGTGIGTGIGTERGVVDLI